LGTVDVEVTTPGGTSSAVAADQFTYVAPPPTVTGISPTSGTTVGGTSVTITGTNLFGVTAVVFGTTAASNVVVTSDTKITVTSPSGFGTVDVEVTTPGGTSSPVAADKFTYTAPPPAISNVVLSDPSGTPTVTVTGSNFGAGAPPGNAETCQNGDTADDFAYPEVFFEDITQGWGAGATGDCVGLKIISWSSTQVVYSFGEGFSGITSGDQVQAVIMGATDTFSAATTLPATAP
jgi:hypothetical protein